MDNTRRRRLGIDIEERRRQNRDAAARHRIRQQQRLEELAYKEVLLKQRLVELQFEVDALRKQREGLRPVIQDPFTTTILDMINSADTLRSGLLQTSKESSEIVLELKRLAEMIVEVKARDEVIDSNDETEAMEIEAKAEAELDVEAEIEAEAELEGGRAQSPRSTRRIRNRLAAARMRTRQKQHLEDLEQRKMELEQRAAELEEELREAQSRNNPLTQSIQNLASMIDELTSVESTMLTGIDECKSLLLNLERLLRDRNMTRNILN
ncbi:hypothetical protein IWW48_004469 [Coemansia sp. RSA 1200]|nr:hypothetical protein IWW48_004469 [Coemansia sp. RSA 1200]